jgi:hypothetical protein
LEVEPTEFPTVASVSLTFTTQHLKVDFYFTAQYLMKDRQPFFICVGTRHDALNVRWRQAKLIHAALSGHAP